MLNRIIVSLLLSLILVVSTAYGNDKESYFTENLQWLTMKSYDIRVCKVTFLGLNDKEAILDFCGNEMLYTGDLVVNEAAKIFFNEVLSLYTECKGNIYLKETAECWKNRVEDLSYFERELRRVQNNNDMLMKKFKEINDNYEMLLKGYIVK